jgi:hypothetical protein
MTSTILKQYYCKANNRRVWIEMHYFESVKKYLFKISTRTLKKDREIYNAENWYTPETFVLLKDLLNVFVDTQLLAAVYMEKFSADVSTYNVLKEHIK